ncbi:hypothetical protein [Streptosporangium sp. NPDC006007]|uniref:hypothetical protein n=1 Tax=Streptosporangium sp. NPDC006007 TaxID=3154575 RepID=UPI0033A2EE7C
MRWRRDPHDTHTSGRHRAGQVRTAVVHRRLWDGPARAQAERLARTWPSWVVLYGVGSRRFYAIATWQISEPLMVDAVSSEELERRMYEAVMTVTARREAPLTTPTPPAPPTLLASSSSLSRRGSALSPAPAAAPHHSRRLYQGAA